MELSLVRLLLTNGLVGGVTGGIISQLASHRLSRSKPQVRLAEVMLKTAQPDIGDGKSLARKILEKKAVYFFRVPKEVWMTLRNSDYVDAPDEYYQHPSQYTSALFKANRDNEEVQLLHSDIPHVLKELKRTLYAGLLKDFFVDWHSYQRVLWGQMLGECIRGNFQLGNSQPKGGGHPIHSSVVDEDGDFLVNMGRNRFNFIWSPRKSHKLLVQPFAKSAASAFAYEDVDVLKCILAFLESRNWNDPSIQRVSQVIAEELAKYRKVVIRGVISNAGRSSVPISGQGRFVIASDGFEYRDQAEPAPPVRKLGRVVVEMSMMHENLFDELPSMVIPGGGAVPFEAHSDKYLFQLPDHNEIKALYGSERTAFLQLRRLDQGKVLASNEVRFCEFRADDVFGDTKP